MTNRTPPDDAGSGSQRDTVVTFPILVSSPESSKKMDQTEAVEGRESRGEDIGASPLSQLPEDGQERNLQQWDTILTEARDPGGYSGDASDRLTSSAVHILQPRTSVSAHADREIVRHRTNEAVRPLLKAYARSRGIMSQRLEEAIDGHHTLTHQVIARELGGALHSEAVRKAIADNVDHTLVPSKVRVGVAAMLAQNIAAPPSSAARQAFPDWNKALYPFGQRHLAWHAEDAARWLERFPPNGELLHPLDTWDDITAAQWLNDRGSTSIKWPDSSEDGVVVAFVASNQWKPALEVLHNLDELEQEELAYRVFVERLRRDVMPALTSERRIQVQDAVMHVITGYQSLKEARRSIYKYDQLWIDNFDHIFDENCEAIYDLCSKILGTSVWPHGFSVPELSSEFYQQDGPTLTMRRSDGA